jgi:hypothetical protein
MRELGEEDAFLLGFLIGGLAAGLQLLQGGAGLFDGALRSVTVGGGAPQLFERVLEGLGFHGFEANEEHPFHTAFFRFQSSK